MDDAAVYNADEVDTYAQVVVAYPVTGSATSGSLLRNLYQLRHKTFLQKHLTMLHVPGYILEISLAADGNGISST